MLKLAALKVRNLMNSVTHLWPQGISIGSSKISKQIGHEKVLLPLPLALAAYAIYTEQK